MSWKDYRVDIILPGRVHRYRLPAKDEEMAEDVATDRLLRDFGTSGPYKVEVQEIRLSNPTHIVAKNGDWYPVIFVPSQYRAELYAPDKSMRMLYAWECKTPLDGYEIARAWLEREGVELESD